MKTQVNKNDIWAKTAKEFKLPRDVIKKVFYMYTYNAKPNYIQSKVRDEFSCDVSKELVELIPEYVCMSIRHHKDCRIDNANRITLSKQEKSFEFMIKYLYEATNMCMKKAFLREYLWGFNPEGSSDKTTMELLLEYGVTGDHLKILNSARKQYAEAYRVRLYKTDGGK